MQTPHEVNNFSLDLEGKVTRTHYSNQTRDSFLNIPIERVDPFIRALRKFDDLMYQNHITFKLQAGTHTILLSERPHVWQILLLQP